MEAVENSVVESSLRGELRTGFLGISDVRRLGKPRPLALGVEPHKRKEVVDGYLNSGNSC